MRFVELGGALLLSSYPDSSALRCATARQDLCLNRLERRRDSVPSDKKNGQNWGEGFAGLSKT